MAKETILEYCRDRGILHHVGITMCLITENFSVVDQVTIELIDYLNYDEGDEDFIEINFQTEGIFEEVFKKWDKCVNKWCELTSPPYINYIKIGFLIIKEE